MANFPTFERFLRYVATEGGEDQHWTPVSTYCAPCLVRYDAVVKLEETAERDQVRKPPARGARHTCQSLSSPSSSPVPRPT